MDQAIPDHKAQPKELEGKAFIKWMPKQGKENNLID